MVSPEQDTGLADTGAEDTRQGHAAQAVVHVDKEVSGALKISLCLEKKLGS